jgi:hypothetical protein
VPLVVAAFSACGEFGGTIARYRGVGVCIPGRLTKAGDAGNGRNKTDNEEKDSEDFFRRV